MMQYTQWLDEKKQNGSLRALRNIDAVRREREQAGAPFINLSSNDYLSLGDDADLRKEFWSQQDASTLRMSACSSRLLTGTCDQQEAFERELATAYGAEAALVFGSGYHANQGILPAVCTSRTLILADKLVHASLIDGIRMSEGKCIRFRHNDYAQLEMLVQKHVADYENIIIVTSGANELVSPAQQRETVDELRRQGPVPIVLAQGELTPEHSAQLLPAGNAAPAAQELDDKRGKHQQADGNRRGQAGKALTRHTGRSACAPPTRPWSQARRGAWHPHRGR